MLFHPRKRRRSHLRIASIAPLPGTFVDEVLRDAHADLLFTVRYGGQEALLYVLLEHKSEVDRWTLLQLLRYMLRIWEKYLAEKPAKQTLLPIIPVIIHHSDTGWTAPTHFQGLFAPAVLLAPELRRLTPAFDALLDDLRKSWAIEDLPWSFTRADARANVSSANNHRHRLPQ